MRTLLQINTSLFSGEGQSSRLATAFVDAWRERHPQDRVIVRDIARDPIPHLDAERFRAFRTPAHERTPAQRDAVAQSDALIAELRSAYFDHVARAGLTFRYTADGPEGLLPGKQVYVLAARGGRYEGTPMDTQSDFVRQFLGFLGIEDIQFIYAEGLAMGEAYRDEALGQAGERIQRLAA